MNNPPLPEAGFFLTFRPPPDFYFLPGRFSGFCPPGLFSVAGDAPTPTRVGAGVQFTHNRRGVEREACIPLGPSARVHQNPPSQGTKADRVLPSYAFCSPTKSIMKGCRVGGKPEAHHEKASRAGADATALRVGGDVLCKE